MPFASKRRSRFGRRRNRRNPTVKAIARSVRKIQKEVELKYADSLFEGPVDRSGDLLLLNAMNNSITQAGGRIGSEVRLTSVQWRMSVATDIDNITGPVEVRMIVFYDRQPNGAVPDVSGDPLTAGAALLNSSTVTDLVYAPYQHETQDRYRVLFDRTFLLNPNFAHTTASGVVTKAFQVGKIHQGKIKLNRKVKYDTAASGIGSIVSNALWILFISTALTESPPVYCGARVYYKDA